MLKHYVCNRYKSYSIRNHYFENGKFATDDPAVQALIESAHGYGSIIHPVETTEEIAAMKEAEAAQASEIQKMLDGEEEAPIAVQGARGTAAGRKTRRKMMIVTGSHVTESTEE